MKLPDAYHDWRVVLGVALILLGSGNWMVGRLRTQQYSQIIASARPASPDDAYRSFDDLDSTANAVLEPFTDDQRRVSYATARMDFYHATFLTGYVLVMTGLVVTFFGFLGLIRRDTRRVMGVSRTAIPAASLVIELTGHFTMVKLLSEDAPAKINLYLRVTGRRPDGYHELDSIFVPIALCDRVRIELRPNATSSVTLRCDSTTCRSMGEILPIAPLSIFSPHSDRRPGTNRSQ